MIFSRSIGCLNDDFSQASAAPVLVRQDQGNVLEPGMMRMSGSRQRAPGIRLTVALAGVLALGGIAAAMILSESRALGPEPIGPRDSVMIAISGGPTQIGDDQAPRDERPQFLMKVAAFRLDKSPVTVAQFRSFVDLTGYRTDAERFGTGAVMQNGRGVWFEVPGAYWRYPRGRDEAPAIHDHPVTQVSWNDATAFCEAYGLRLPTEFEWERAARLGQTPDGTVFAAGTAASMEAKLRINIWEGVFPISDTGEDGFRGTSPVGAFGEAPSGLTDLAGNVWEWTSSSNLPYPAPERETRPPAESRVQRGGSFLCSPNVCEGFRASARSHVTPESSLMHVGFRCARDA